MKKTKVRIYEVNLPELQKGGDLGDEEEIYILLLAALACVSQYLYTMLLPVAWCLLSPVYI